MTLSAVLVIVAALLVQTSHGGPGGGQDLKSLGEKIFQKVASAFEKSVIRAGNTCGLPKINNVMKNLTLNEGETARFHCSVDMKCMVTYINWFHDPFNGTEGSGLGEERLLRTGASTGDPYSYVIKGVTYNDEGFYICKAGNTLGETIVVATLEIAGASSLQLSLSVILLSAFYTLLFLQ